MPGSGSLALFVARLLTRGRPLKRGAAHAESTVGEREGREEQPALLCERTRCSSSRRADIREVPLALVLLPRACPQGLELCVWGSGVLQTACVAHSRLRDACVRLDARLIN